MNRVELPFEAVNTTAPEPSRPIVKDYPPRTLEQAKEALLSHMGNQQLLTQAAERRQTELDVLVDKLKTNYRELSKARVQNPYHENQELVVAAYDTHCEISQAQKELFKVTDLALKAHLNVIRANENLLVLEAQAKALDAFDALAKGELA